MEVRLGSFYLRFVVLHDFIALSIPSFIKIRSNARVYLHQSMESLVEVIAKSARQSGSRPVLCETSDVRAWRVPDNFYQYSTYPSRLFLFLVLFISY